MKFLNVIKMITLILMLLIAFGILHASNINFQGKKVDKESTEGLASSAASKDVSANLQTDEESLEDILKSMRSNGDGDIQMPDVYPSLDPYTKTVTSASLMIDIALKRAYKHFMLPGSVPTPELLRFSEEVVDNLKLAFENFFLKIDFHIISFRPGPLVPRRNNQMPQGSFEPTVFVRMNVTQSNSSIVSPLVIFHLTQFTRKGQFGNMTISDEIIFPQNVCNERQVYCLPNCYDGAYCDGQIDCPDTKLDETASCPKCLYKHVKLVSSSNFLDEDENVTLTCTSKSTCRGLTRMTEWHFPPTMASLEMSTKGMTEMTFVPDDKIVSGIYRCVIDGEASLTNITVYKRPDVLLTGAPPNADTIIISEIEGRSVNLWCNTTEGRARWMPVNVKGITISNQDERSSMISFDILLRHMSKSYYCQIQWGNHYKRQIKKTAEIVVVCDRVKHFECNTTSTKRSCIPAKERCDGVEQCADGSDEWNCEYCPVDELSIDVDKETTVAVGDTFIMKCLSTRRLCRPLKWWKKGVLLSTEGNMVRYEDSLFIVNMTPANSGVYRCSDAYNKSSVNVVVIANTGPTLRIDPPVEVINITSGDNVSIACLMNNPLNITDQKERPVWSQENRRVLPNGVNITSKTLSSSTITFNRAHSSMAGIYQCKVKWGISKKREVRVSVRVNIDSLVCEVGEKMCADGTMCVQEIHWCDGESHCWDRSDEQKCVKCNNGYVFVQPSEAEVLVGDTVELRCYYDMRCHPIGWRVPSSTTLLNFSKEITINNNILTISQVKLEHSNTYQCFSGNKSSNSKITVIQKVELNLSSPYAFLPYGKNFSVECRTNYGKARWRRMDMKPLSDIKGVDQTYRQPNTATLSFVSPSYDARGFYLCFVSLSKRQKDVESNLMYVHVYDLKCPSDNIICDNNTKCIPESKVCDSVTDCQDFSDERNCSKCNSEIRAKQIQKTITTNGYGSFECVVPNRDCLPIEWKSKDRLKLKNPRFTTYENFLYVFSPRLVDSGTYFCVSGQRSASMTLIVKELRLTILPDQTKNSAVYMMKGQNRTFVCESNLGSPEWSYQNMYSEPVHGVIFDKISKNATSMTIINARADTSRVYLCKVVFSRETKKILMTVNVT